MHSLSDRRLGGPGGAAQLIREAGGGACDEANCRSSCSQLQFQVRGIGSLVPSPTPMQLFIACPILQATPTYGKQRKDGRGTGDDLGYTVPERNTPSCRENLSLQLTSGSL